MTSVAPTIRRSRYDRKAVQLHTSGESKVQQDIAETCDINHILGRFNVTGQVDPQHLNKRTPQYDDYTNVGDYQSALDAVHATTEAFATLPALLRSRLLNNPANLISYLQDPKNRDEAIALGLVQPPEGYVAPPKPGTFPPAEGETPPPTKPSEPPTPPVAPKGPIDSS